MTQCESAVVYDGLPISSGGAHGLGRISVRRAHSSWATFLETYGSDVAESCYFDFPNTPELTAEPDVRSAVAEAFPASGRKHEVPSDRVREALDLMTALEPQPTNPWGMAPVWLCFSAEFVLRRPTGGVWPDQERERFGFFETPTGVRLGRCVANLNIEAKRSMGLLLSVPNVTDEEAAELAQWLQADLPFRLSAKHWSRWTLTKNGRTYRGRKIAI